MSLSPHDSLRWAMDQINPNRFGGLPPGTRPYDIDCGEEPERSWDELCESDPDYCDWVDSRFGMTSAADEAYNAFVEAADERDPRRAEACLAKALVLFKVQRREFRKNAAIDYLFRG